MKKKQKAAVYHLITDHHAFKNIIHILEKISNLLHEYSSKKTNNEPDHSSIWDNISLLIEADYTKILEQTLKLSATRFLSDDLITETTEMVDQLLHTVLHVLAVRIDMNVSEMDIFSGTSSSYVTKKIQCIENILHTSIRQRCSQLHVNMGSAMDFLNFIKHSNVYLSSDRYDSFENLIHNTKKQGISILFHNFVLFRETVLLFPTLMKDILLSMNIVHTIFFDNNHAEYPFPLLSWKKSNHNTHHVASAMILFYKWFKRKNELYALPNISPPKLILSRELEYRRYIERLLSAPVEILPPPASTNEATHMKTHHNSSKSYIQSFIPLDLTHALTKWDNVPNSMPNVRWVYNIIIHKTFSFNTCREIMFNTFIHTHLNKKSSIHYKTMRVCLLGEALSARGGRIQDNNNNLNRASYIMICYKSTPYLSKLNTCLSTYMSYILKVDNYCLDTFMSLLSSSILFLSDMRKIVKVTEYYISKSMAVEIVQKKCYVCSYHTKMMRRNALFFWFPNADVKNNEQKKNSKSMDYMLWILLKHALKALENTIVYKKSILYDFLSVYTDEKFLERQIIRYKFNYPLFYRHLHELLIENYLCMVV